MTKFKEILQHTDDPYIIELYEKLIERAFEETLRKAKLNYTPAKELYHYCSLETFHSIIESNCFWLSHPKFMNDKEENKYSIREANKAIEKYVRQYDQKKDNDDDSKDLLKLIELELRKNEIKYNRFDENKYEKINFFTCFSSDGDSLPMWSMYRGKDIGLSIGLDFTEKDYFVKFPKEENEKSPFTDSNTYFTEIVYEYEKMEKAIYIFLDQFTKDWHNNQDQFKNIKNTVNEGLSRRVAALLTFLSFFLKNNNFNYEQETRILLSYHEEKDIKFRVRDKFIVPYIEFPLDNNKQKFNKPIIPIKSITISPNAEEPQLVIASIRAYLNHKGYNIDKIKIAPSTIPYKPR